MFTMRSAVRLRRRGRAQDGRRGQALAEFAIVIPILLLIVAGMVDFGVGLYTYVTMANGARDGVRLAATTCDVSSCIDGSVEARMILPTGSTTTVTCAPPGSSDAAFTRAKCAATTVNAGDTVRVRVLNNPSLIWPLPGVPPINLAYQVDMMVEGN